MRLADALPMSWRALAAHRGRSFLTLLGIAIGIAAVILLTSIGEGLHRFVLSEFTQFGTHVIGISPGKTSTGGANPGFPSSVRPLTLADAQALRRLPDVLQVAPRVSGNAEIGGNGRLRRALVYGTTAALSEAFQLRVYSGQFLPADDAESARDFAVLGARLKQELFGNANALGAGVRIGGQRFRVIGVMEARGQFLGVDLDDVAYVPALRGLELFNREGLMEISLTYAEGARAARVVEAVRQLLRARHGREDFTLVTQEDMLRTLSNILDILTMAVAALGSISLLVGAVGIVTIMTIAVAERTTEIGLLMALGARRATVLRLFLGEAVVLSGLGGVLGLAIGIGLAQSLRLALPALPVHTPMVFVVAAQAVALSIGLAAGVMPAYRAARLDPVAALRAE
jgi:putative ABC transport system permease protein